MPSVSTGLVLGLPWTSGTYDFNASLTGRTILCDWREHNCGTVLLTVGTADGGLVVDDAAAGETHFDLTAAQTELLRPVTEAHPGARRRFDVHAYDEDGGFSSKFEVVAEA